MWDEVLFVLKAGLDSLLEYLSAHVLTCLIPAFFIAGAIAAFISKGSILKYFGPNAKKVPAYALAAVSGAVLAVCSCTILPLFAGIYRRGAGVGPATAFLFSGPAINVLAIILTARVLGYQLGIARAIAAIGMSLVIGIVMALIFRKGADTGAEEEFGSENEAERLGWATVSVILLLVAILIIGSMSTNYLPLVPKLIGIYFFTVAIFIILIFKYDKKDVAHWGAETWWLGKKLFPILLAGVILIGVIGGVAALFVKGSTPQNSVGYLLMPVLGGNSITSCLVASLMGVILYMPTLLEIPIIGQLLGYSSGIMGGGPALSLLLSGPTLSLPSIIVIGKTMGAKKTAVYVALVTVISTLVGFGYGQIWG
ncbi:MAG: hypothetical protein CVT48_03770 [Thermoplasmata archaeon HGW-Thermoplasmata-1]|nr:MAG: hypothetical protein CVT48_03770 [Thermoplasmata archaeon HGW-Thermoplasmata-1]